MMSSILVGAWLLLAPDFPELLGTCEVVQRFDGLEDEGIAPIPRMPGFDDLCAEARETLKSVKRS